MHLPDRRLKRLLGYTQLNSHNIAASESDRVQPQQRVLLSAANKYHGMLTLDLFGIQKNNSVTSFLNNP